MAHIITDIDGVQLKLSNLDKVLWPVDGQTKAELIQYYMSVFPYMLPLIQLRPLTLIRYPDGIDGNRFYSKNAAEFTPEWMSHCQVEDINYLIIAKKADLIYIANLAGLEIHAMNNTCSEMARPDTIIFDLDPSEGVSFDIIKNTCLELCFSLSELGYHPHIKTSGSKGLHIYVPILPIYSREQIIQTAKEIGNAYIEKNKNTTLKISKEKREGKILIDIYRNHQGQTCIAPLSTRAKENAPVSMPLILDDMSLIRSSSQFNILNALEYLESQQPWKDYSKLAVRLHNAKEEANEISPQISQTTPTLEVYERKRDFSKTSEPSGIKEDPDLKKGNRFVVQLHDASNLHYDLRLEENGVLSSWAIPKSIPTERDIKRLAIRTEDHPLPYINFEGTIPKGEYGGGTMWIFDTGDYALTKKEKDSYRFQLTGKTIKGEYILYHTRENQWIIERKSDVESNNIIPEISPMLADQSAVVPDPERYFYELKWDGIRLFVKKRGNQVSLLSRSGRDITAQFPEIAEKILEMKAENVILDGELVSPDEKGAPIFANIISRMHTKGKPTSDMTRRMHPAVLYLFDMIHLDGKNCMTLPIEKRREWLKAVTPVSDKIRMSDTFEDGEGLFAAARNMGLEGIIAKKKGSFYTAGKRSADWLKVKVRTLIDVIIIGYTKGKGDRSSLFGALHVAKWESDHLVYLGKIGTGFDENKMTDIYTIVKELTVTSKPIKDNVEEEYNSIWVEPKVECEVQYASITPNGTLREPVFYRLKTNDE